MRISESSEPVILAERPALGNRRKFAGSVPTVKIESEATMTTTLLFGLLLIAGVVGSLLPQTQASQSSKIENFIKSKEPAWQFSSPAREAEPESTFYQWQKGEEWIYFRVFVTDSKQAAAANLKSSRGTCRTHGRKNCGVRVMKRYCGKAQTQIRA